MDLMQILIAAGLGAAGGGIGALVGTGIGKLFPEKARQIAVVVFAVLGIALSQTFTDRFQEKHLESQIRASTISESEFMAYIAEHFPEEFSAMTRAVAKNPKGKFAEAQGFALVSGLRKDNAELIFQASATDISNYLKSSTDLHTLIRDQYGAKACANFLLKGPPGISEHAAAQQANFENLGLMLFRVIVNGRNNQTDRTLSTDEDWDNFFTAWRNANGTEAMQTAVTSPETAGEELCDAWISMTKQLLEMDDEGAERLKTQLVYIQAAN